MRGIDMSGKKDTMQNASEEQLTDVKSKISNMIIQCSKLGTEDAMKIQIELYALGSKLLMAKNVSLDSLEKDLKKANLYKEKIEELLQANEAIKRQAAQREPSQPAITRATAITRQSCRDRVNATMLNYAELVENTNAFKDIVKKMDATQQRQFLEAAKKHKDIPDKIRSLKRNLDLHLGDEHLNLMSQEDADNLLTVTFDKIRALNIEIAKMNNVIEEAKAKYAASMSQKEANNTAKQERFKNPKDASGDESSLSKGEEIRREKNIRKDRTRRQNVASLQRTRDQNKQIKLLRKFSRSVEKYGKIKKDEGNVDIEQRGKRLIERMERAGIERSVIENGKKYFSEEGFDSNELKRNISYAIKEIKKAPSDKTVQVARVNQGQETKVNKSQEAEKILKIARHLDDLYKNEKDDRDKIDSIANKISSYTKQLSPKELKAEQEFLKALDGFMKPYTDFTEVKMPEYKDSRSNKNLTYEYLDESIKSFGKYAKDNEYYFLRMTLNMGSFDEFVYNPDNKKHFDKLVEYLIKPDLDKYKLDNPNASKMDIQEKSESLKSSGNFAAGNFDWKSNVTSVANQRPLRRVLTMHEVMKNMDQASEIYQHAKIVHFDMKNWNVRIDATITDRDAKRDEKAFDKLINEIVDELESIPNQNEIVIKTIMNILNTNYYKANLAKDVQLSVAITQAAQPVYRDLQFALNNVRALEGNEKQLTKIDNMLAKSDLYKDMNPSMRSGRMVISEIEADKLVKILNRLNNKKGDDQLINGICDNIKNIIAEKGGDANKKDLFIALNKELNKLRVLENSSNMKKLSSVLREVDKQIEKSPWSKELNAKVNDKEKIKESKVADYKEKKKGIQKPTEQSEHGSTFSLTRK